MVKNKAFILLELVIALSLLSALLLFSQHWVSQQLQHSRAVLQLPEAQQMLTAIEYFWLQERRAPNSLSELVSKGYIAKVWQPWPGQWQLEQHENMLRLLLPATDVTLARATSAQLPGAQLNSSNELALHIFEPIQLALHRRYLHRSATTGAPEYNQMETDLDVRGHALRNVGILQGDRVVASTVTLSDAQFNQVLASTFESETLTATKGYFGGYEVSELAARFEQLQLQWQQCRSNGGCQ